MTPVDAIETMLDLFAGRPDAWGGDEGRAVYAPVNEQLMEGHLYGVQGIGTYPCRFQNPDPETTMVWSQQGQMDNMVVKWGCCDIDTGDWSEAYRLAITLQKMNLQPWIERSKSKGWHVWIFVENWIPAYVMRRCLKVAYSAIDLQAKEANPKSELLRPNQLGNYVRLPYKGVFGHPDQTFILERQTFVTDWSVDNDGGPLDISDFVMAYEQGDIVSSETKIRAWADKWFEPPRTLSVNDIEYPSDSEIAELRYRLDRSLRTLFDNGPRARDGQQPDTSQGLAALAHNTAQQGWSESDVYKLVVAADARWGKYSTRVNPDDYFQDLVERAFR